ncbi:MAG: hypothetical protein ACE1ZE_01180 [Candidatus Binatia bacterium]
MVPKYYRGQWDPEHRSIIHFIQIGNAKKDRHARSFGLVHKFPSRFDGTSAEGAFKENLWRGYSTRAWREKRRRQAGFPKCGLDRN